MAFLAKNSKAIGAFIASLLALLVSTNFISPVLAANVSELVGAVLNSGIFGALVAAGVWAAPKNQD